METLEKRALYNLIRMNSLYDPTLPTEPWQVEDYRAISTSELYERLKQADFPFDHAGFIGFSEAFDSPEELSDHLVADRLLKPAEEDKIYLLIFELWRRLLPDQPSLSILCDELDRQIYCYDQDIQAQPLALEEALEKFIKVLQENVDQGMDPENVFEGISNYFANDIETFFYDFISEKMDEENESYAEELIEALDPYLMNNKWFVLLRFRFYASIHNQIGRKLLQDIFDEYLPENDLEFNLEFLSILASLDSPPIFSQVINETFPLLKEEEHFQDLLDIFIDFCSKSRQENTLKIAAAILKERGKRPLNSPLSKGDPDIQKIVQLIQMQAF